jgi:hypothetical protein
VSGGSRKKYGDLSTPLIQLAQGFGRDDTFSVLSKIEEPVDPDGGYLNVSSAEQSRRWPVTSDRFPPRAIEHARIPVP